MNVVRYRMQLGKDMPLLAVLSVNAAMIEDV